MNPEENYKVIEGIKCYAPELAFGNENFPVEVYALFETYIDKNFWYMSRNRLIKWFVAKFADKEISDGNPKGVQVPFGASIRHHKKNLLEIGCGTGYVLKGLSTLKYINLSGSDIHVEAIKLAKQKLPNINFFQSDISSVNTNQKYDIVCAFDIIEHIDSDTLAIENIYKYLNKNGIFLLTVPQHKYLWSAMDDIVNHKRRYSRKEIVTKIKTVGFKIKFVSSFAFTIFPFMLFLRLINKGTNNDVDNQNNLNIIKNNLKLPYLINKFFEFLMKIDEFLIRHYISLPFGGSLFIIAQK